MVIISHHHIQNTFLLELYSHPHEHDVWTMYESIGTQTRQQCSYRNAFGSKYPNPYSTSTTILVTLTEMTKTATLDTKSQSFV